MGFKKTSEGRVFFKNADNDDIPCESSNISEAVMPKDSTQMQVLMLLKSLNTKLKSSREGQASIKKELEQYKKTIKKLETKSSTNETNYIDLEQKIATKQNESNKKSSRVENNVKKLLEQIKEAKQLVKELEDKDSKRDESLSSLKDELEEKISSQTKNDKDILKRQKELEAKQDEQGEKMVGNIAAYVALTKRVSDTETKNEALDNKIESATSEYIKLDRKIDKAIEDRNRILRKVDRIEQAVLETRDALNAKAMVLLTDQGVAGIDMPQIADKSLQTDPSVLNRRLQEEAIMPWWRRPVRLQGTSFVLIMIVALLLGWIISEARRPSPIDNNISKSTANNIPIVNLDNQYADNQANKKITDDINANLLEPSTDMDSYDTYDNAYDNETPSDNNAENDYGVTIHNGYDDPSQITDKNTDVNDTTIDLNNNQELLDAFEKNPEELATQLNQIEPSSLTTNDMSAPAPKIEKQATSVNNSAYIASLKSRISPDKNLSGTAKKIETQAFKGVPEAQHDMGAIYVAGHGAIKKDLNRAILWFTEAANNGVANAKYNLGVLYHQGRGVEQNINKAIKLYEEAAALGHPEAQYNLGIANIEGIGVAYNPKRAAMFFERAANKNVTEAAYNLGLIYENGLLGESQPDAALAWYKRASDNGSQEARTAMEELATSLGLSMSDVERIVDKFELTHKPISSEGSASNIANSYMISQIQKELMRRGLYPGPIDGMSGPMTENAIRKFQKEANIKVDGKYSTELLSYLRASL